MAYLKGRKRPKLNKRQKGDNGNSSKIYPYASKEEYYYRNETPKQYCRDK
jgi:hypothetical protein